MMFIMINTTSYAYSDITDESLKSKIEILSEYNIINGYEDGTFRPHNQITRSEFCKMIICTTMNEATEEELLYSWVKSLPKNYAKEMLNLYDEMAKRESAEAKVYKAIDSLEALIQHNISDLSTWIPKEYELNKTYADDKVAFSEYLKELREEIRKDTLEKIGK